MWLTACAALTPKSPIARRRSVAEAAPQRSRTPTATFTPYPRRPRGVASPRDVTEPAAHLTASRQADARTAAGRMYRSPGRVTDQPRSGKSRCVKRGQAARVVGGSWSGNATRAPAFQQRGPWLQITYWELRRHASRPRPLRCCPLRQYVPALPRGVRHRHGALGPRRGRPARRGVWALPAAGRAELHRRRLAAALR